jgi:hypothetical protein
MMSGDLVQIGSSVWCLVDGDIPGGRLRPKLRVVQNDGETGIKCAVIPRGAAKRIGTPTLVPSDKLTFFGQKVRLAESWLIHSPAVRLTQSHLHQQRRPR